MTRNITVHRPVRRLMEQLTALGFKLDDSFLNMSRYHQGNRLSLATRASPSTLNGKAWDSGRGCPSALLSRSKGNVWFIHRPSFILSVSPSWPVAAGELTHSLFSSRASVCVENWDLTTIFRRQPDVTGCTAPTSPPAANMALQDPFSYQQPSVQYIIIMVQCWTPVQCSGHNEWASGCCLLSLTRWINYDIDQTNIGSRAFTKERL